MSHTHIIHPQLGREVAVGAIDHELRLLWEEDDARTNASLVNLVIYGETSDALVRNSEAVRELTREHACRALLVGIDRHTEATEIRAWITAHCHLHHGRKSICCEQIAFQLSGRATGRLGNTVLAHLNSDLPLIFWWQGELSPIFDDRLYTLVDRFVFDSSEWSDPVRSFRWVVGACNDAPRLVVQDLAWTRSYQFRVSVAAVFDDPVAQQTLAKIDRVHIRYHPDHRMTAVQLLAWLATQASWRDGLELARSSHQEDRFLFESIDGQAIEAVLVADHQVAPLESLEMVAGDAVIEILHTREGDHLTRRFRGADHQFETPGPADPTDPVDLLGEQLSRGGRNTLLRKTIPRMLGLLER